MSDVEPNGPPGGGYSVSLPSFEGPLDLLLHLCQKHELDILDIPIAFVTEKYLEYLSVMQLIDLDVASEYLVMAATLAHIKSKSLLPAPPPGQEDELTLEEQDPREALIRRLLEYQKYKQAGADLAARGVAGRDVFTRGMPMEQAVETGLPPLAQVPLFSLVEAFQSVLAKSKVKLSHDIVHERVTLTDRINELVDILREKRRVTFEELFQKASTTFDLVITFLALLEMTRLRMTRLFQTDFDSPIYVEFAAQVSADDETVEVAESEAVPPPDTASEAAEPDAPEDLDGDGWMAETPEDEPSDAEIFARLREESEEDAPSDEENAPSDEEDGTDASTRDVATEDAGIVDADAPSPVESSPSSSEPPPS